MLRNDGWQVKVQRGKPFISPQLHFLAIKVEDATDKWALTSQRDNIFGGRSTS